MLESKKHSPHSGTLDRRKPHGWPHRGFTDRLGIRGIVLVGLDERFDILRRDQSHLVAEIL